MNPINTNSILARFLTARTVADHGRISRFEDFRIQVRKSGLITKWRATKGSRPGDIGNGTMSDLGSHDNDVPYTVLDLKRPNGKGGLVLAPLTIEAISPNVPVAHKELAPATMKVTYEFGAVGSQPALKLVWYQGDIRPSGWTPTWGGRSCLFIGNKGMLLGNGKLLAEERFKEFQTPPRSPGHWVEWVNYAKGQGPVPGSNFQYSGWTTEANHLGNVAYRTGRKIEWDPVNLRATNAPEAAPFIKRPVYRKGWDDILKNVAFKIRLRSV